MSYTDDSVRSFSRTREPQQGGWQEAPGSERPFSPRFDTESGHESEAPGVRPKWAWVLAAVCVSGLLWIALGSDSLDVFSGAQPTSVQQTQSVNSRPEPTTAKISTPPIKRRGVAEAGSVQTPPAPWLEGVAGLPLVPPNEPLSDVAESLSPEWRVSLLAQQGVWDEAVLPMTASELMATNGPPQSTLRLINDPEPTLNQRLQACDGKGFFATANCRAQVCATYGADAPQCKIDASMTLP